MSFFTNTNPPAAGLFSNPPANSATANAPSTSLFGASASGAVAAAKPATGGPFGTFGASSNTSNSGTSSGNLFGGGGSATTGTAGGLFGGATSIPAPSTTTTGGGLFGGGAATNTSTNSLFGGTPSNATSNAPPSTSANPLFGGLNPNKPAESTASRPATSLFGQPSTTTGNASTNLSGGLFGNLPPKPTEASNVAQSSAAPSGGLFGSKPAATAASASTTAPPFSLGGHKDTNPLPAFSLGGNKDSPTPAPPTGGLFGTKPAEKKDGAPAPAPAFNLFGGAKAEEKKETNAAPASKDGEQNKTAATNATTTKAIVAVPPPSMLRGKTVEEIVNRWTSDLETHVKDFSRFAGEVAVWDRALVENGNNLAALHSHVQAAEKQQSEIDQTLDAIEQQQKELLTTLDTYEKESQTILGSQGGSARALDTGPADSERDKNYMLASDLHTNLDDLSTSLTQMIDSVNALSIAQKSPNEGGDDAMTQVSQILSSHLESLQWIDTAVRDVGSKVSEVEKRVKDSGQSYGNGSRQRGFGLNR